MAIDFRESDFRHFGWNSNRVVWCITQGAIVSGHLLISWTHISKSACYFVDALRCVRAADQNMAAYNHLVVLVLQSPLGITGPIFPLAPPDRLEDQFWYWSVYWSKCWSEYWSEYWIGTSIGLRSLLRTVHFSSLSSYFRSQELTMLLSSSIN